MHNIPHLGANKNFFFLMTKYGIDMNKSKRASLSTFFLYYETNLT